MFSDFKVEAAHQAANVGEAEYEKHEAPLSSLVNHGPRLHISLGMFHRLRAQHGHCAQLNAFR